MKNGLTGQLQRGLVRWLGFQRERPRALAIEPTNHCTRSCVICGAAQAADPRPRGFMSWHLYSHLITQVAALGPRQVSLYAHGEPLLHDRIVDMVHEATAAGVASEIVTNGDRLTPALVQALHAAGLSSLVLSYPGTTPEAYAACRGTAPPPNDMERLREALRAWRNGGRHLSIRCLVLPAYLRHGHEELVEFAEQWFSIPTVDMIGLHGYQPWPRHQQEELLTCLHQHPARCEAGLDKLIVLWDGTMTLCSYDAGSELRVGHAPEDALRQAYNSKAARAIRRAWFRGRRHWPELCRSCLLPQVSAAFVPVGRDLLKSGNRDVLRAYMKSALRSLKGP